MTVWLSAGPEVATLDYIIIDSKSQGLVLIHVVNSVLYRLCQDLLKGRQARTLWSVNTCAMTTCTQKSIDTVVNENSSIDHLHTQRSDTVFG